MFTSFVALMIPPHVPNSGLPALRFTSRMGQFFLQLLLLLLQILDAFRYGIHLFLRACTEFSRYYDEQSQRFRRTWGGERLLYDFENPP